MQQELKTLLAKVPEVNRELILKAVRDQKVEPTQASLDKLRARVLSQHATLRTATDKIDLPKLVHDHGLLTYKQFNTHTWEAIAHAIQQLTSLYPSSHYTVRARISSPEHFSQKHAQNGIRALFDIVGLQVVPHDSRDFIAAIHTLDTGTYEKLFVFNTFPFSERDFATKVGPDSSPYYRALHTYINIGSICAEVQFRTPVIDQWSRLHHETIYKPKIAITNRERKLIQQLGVCANWTDFTQLLHAT